MHILFNTNVINFENDIEKKGIDFAAYDSVNDVWAGGSFDCYDSVDILNKSACKIYDQNEAGNY